MRYSAFALAREAIAGHKNWPKMWRSPEPKSSYEAVIIGGGGHGLAAAYYLGKNFGITNVAVLEKGWIGGGNTGRNTTVIRSNYLQKESATLYDEAIDMWGSLDQELNFNLMVSQRGLLHLAHSTHDMQEIGRRSHAMYMHGVDAELITPAQVKDWIPFIRLNGRYPVMGALLQRRGGTIRHDAVAWGYARAADTMGIDIIQNCDVTGFQIENGSVTGVETNKGPIRTSKVGITAAAHSTELAEKAGFRLPIEAVPLQALVSDPLKPVMNCVALSNTVHAYLSQSDKGELVIGGGTDPQISWSQRGGFYEVENMISAVLELYPIFSKLRMMRQWGGTVDVTPDRSPLISKTPVRGMYVDCGWGTGGFKATPVGGRCLAHMIATDAPDELAAPFSIDRYFTGALIDEGSASAVAH
ncbi:MAG: sarcosine oxidase subunit beta family protein [Rhodobacteraceae bacterium]|nr:sarcosine oxidase subunit beta family protein [Paracoccaceae bacterium]